MTSDAWPSEWYRAILWACALTIIGELQGEAYGYSIGSELARRHLGPVGGGTSYPILKRLEADGLVTTHRRDGQPGPGRKHYDLSEKGRSRLAEAAARWSEFATISTTLLEGR